MIDIQQKVQKTDFTVFRGRIIEIEGRKELLLRQNYRDTVKGRRRRVIEGENGKEERSLEVEGREEEGTMYKEGIRGDGKIKNE